MIINTIHKYSQRWNRVCDPQNANDIKNDTYNNTKHDTKMILKWYKNDTKMNNTNQNPVCWASHSVDFWYILSAAPMIIRHIY